MSSGRTITNGGLTQINSVTVNAPVAGTAIISGTVFVNNDQTANVLFYISTNIDGVALAPNPVAQEFSANGAVVGELQTMAYSVSVPLSAGSHTISQDLGPSSGTATWFFNRNQLSVAFLPQGSVTPSPQSIGEAVSRTD